MDERIVEILKGLIEKNGPEYIKTHPFESYKALMESSYVDRQTAGGVLLCILNGVIEDILPDTSEKELAGIISQECAFSATMATRLSSLFLTLYSSENLAIWSRNERKGVRDFLSHNVEFSWEGFSTWEVQNIYVECHFDASFVLKPSSLTAEDKGLCMLTDKNPFITCDEIKCYFEESMQEYLNGEFDWYCTAEEYYEPTPQDFECESYLSEWCKKHGFEIVYYEGKGYDDGIQSI